MRHCIGIDLGTSAVKIILVNELGKVVLQTSKSYPLIQEEQGYSEQDPSLWVSQTIEGLKEIVNQFNGPVNSIEGISFSGQMHGLVLLDDQNEVIRPCILWNDTRTTKQCLAITSSFGEEILDLTKNKVLEGFTLPKLLWVKENEKENFHKIKTFLLPKDYVRFMLTGQLHMDYSDAAGTLLLDIDKKKWSDTIVDHFQIPSSICPKLVESYDCVGTITKKISELTGLSPSTKVFAGGADNACGAIGAKLTDEKTVLCSIGTSGVILANEIEDSTLTYDGALHVFNHSKPNSLYSMGVTLSAGQSLNWLKQTFFKNVSFDAMLEGIEEIPIGSLGLIFTPYLYGERTPHTDAFIRGSFIGIDARHTNKHFVKSVMEGITFSLNEIIHSYRQKGKTIEKVISIGGGAKNNLWLQMQADIFNAKVIRLDNEQGPALGAAMIAAYGLSWYPSFEVIADLFLKEKDEFTPNVSNVKQYEQLMKIYQTVYNHTKEINTQLQRFR